MKQHSSFLVVTFLVLISALSFMGCRLIPEGDVSLDGAISDPTLEGVPERLDVQEDLEEPAKTIVVADKEVRFVADKQRDLNSKASKSIVEIEAKDTKKVHVAPAQSIKKVIASSNTLTKRLDATADKLGEARTQLRNASDTAGDLRRVAEERADAVKELRNHIEDLQKEIEDGKKALQKEKSKAKNRLNLIFGALTALGVLGVGFAVYIFLSGNPGMALKVGGAGIATSVISSTLILYIEKIALAIFGAFGLFLTFIIWQAYVAYQARKEEIADQEAKNKEREALQHAVEETVATVEVMKGMVTGPDRTAFFGDYGTNGIAGQIQKTPSTFGIVQEARKKYEEVNKPTVSTK